MRELSSSDITKEALLILSARNIEAWRANNLAVRGRKFIGMRGCSDILGFNRSTGQLIAVEVKKNGDKLSEDQRRFLSMVKKSGAVALVAVQDGPNVSLKEYQND